jgi:hypothetical protein
MSINQITKIRLPSGQEVALTDWSDRPIYSTVDFLSGWTDEELRAFTYSSSESVTQSGNFAAAARRVATLQDTNISQSSEMASTEEYLVYQIKVELFQYYLAANLLTINQAGLPVPIAPNVAHFNSRIIGELEVSDKAFPQAGIGWFLTGFGPEIAGIPSAAARTYANQGSPQHDASYSMSLPVHIGGTEDYSFIFHNPTGAAVGLVDDAAAADATAVLQARVYLCGLHKRPTA